MKALVKRESAVGLWLEDIPEPTIGINDVLIKILKTGICGTDVHIYKWDAWAQRTIPVPMAVGHEFVGEVIEVGSNVTDFHPGEIVSGEGHVGINLHGAVLQQFSVAQGSRFNSLHTLLHAASAFGDD